MMKGVYVFHLPSTDLYKIGRSNDIAQRLAGLSDQMPYELEQIAAWEEKDFPWVLESRLHNLFSEKRVRGEWFKLSNDDLRLCEATANSFDAEAVRTEKAAKQERKEATAKLRKARTSEEMEAVFKAYPESRNWVKTVGQEIHSS